LAKRVATALHHRLLNSGLDRLEADVPSHSLARARRLLTKWTK
jgi:hypothetical protein